MVKNEYYGNESFGLTWDRIEMFKIISECKITETRTFIPVTTRFLTEKMDKNEVYGNECFGLAWDRIKVRQTNLFITAIKIYLFIFFRLKTCFYKYDNVVVMSRLVVKVWEVRISRFWDSDTLQTFLGKKKESFEIGTCLTPGLIKNSSKILKWWPKFKKNVMLEKTRTANRNNKATAFRVRT